MYYCTIASALIAVAYEFLCGLQQCGTHNAYQKRLEFGLYILHLNLGCCEFIQIDSGTGLVIHALIPRPQTRGRTAVYPITHTY